MQIPEAIFLDFYGFQLNCWPWKPKSYNLHLEVRATDTGVAMLALDSGSVVSGVCIWASQVKNLSQLLWKWRAAISFLDVVQGCCGPSQQPSRSSFGGAQCSDGCPGTCTVEDGNSYHRLQGVRIGCCWCPAIERPRMINRRLGLGATTPPDKVTCRGCLPQLWSQVSEFIYPLDRAHPSHLCLGENLAEVKIFALVRFFDRIALSENNYTARLGSGEAIPFLWRQVSSAGWLEGGRLPSCASWQKSSVQGGSAVSI